MRDLKEIDKQQLWGSKNSLGRWAIFYVQKILDFLENGKKFEPNQPITAKKS